MYQKTLNSAVEFSGIGLHTGRPVKARVLPSAGDTGISFIRKDIPDSPVIKVESANVTATSYATTLGVNGVTVSTVEHILSAFYALGVDNAVVEVFGPEIPIMDGSAGLIADMLEAVGLRSQNSPKKYLLVKKPIKITEGGKYIHLLPPRQEGEFNLTIDYTIDFAHPYLDRQSFKTTLTPEVFKKELRQARTFGFLRDVEMLKTSGLAIGGSLDNAVVIGETSILNEGGLRFEDEFVRHKVVDLIGDISLAGLPIIGKIKAFRSGHSLNQELVSKLLKSRGAWKVVERIEEDAPEEISSFFGEELAIA